ncbi:diguanylate cyclase/phosphodiesterase (GGDEF & EAL domains) with PAS/PAC sensor(s) [hydrothermal vent metagenome]|uniref:histidine kinase n=1 Tax=hydrothermal vent metagenome TaxID=652676 RepID=A0A3B1BXV3_9ZZZZ
MSFRAKTILGIAAIEIILLALLILGGLNYLLSSSENALIKRANDTASFFATVTKDAVLSTDLVSLESFVKEILKNERVVYARIIADGILLAEGGQQSSLTRPYKKDVSLADVEDDVFDVSAKIKKDGATVGRVELGLSISEMTKVMDDAKNFFSIIAVIGIIMTALFSFILGSLLTRQLKALNDASEKLGAGNLGYQVKVKGNDEIAHAAVAFNKMSSRLKSLNSELTESMAEIEMERDLISKTEKLLGEITSHASDAIVMVDVDGKISFWNSAAMEIFGYTSHEIIGKNFSGIITERILEKNEREYSVLKEAGQQQDSETVEMGGIRKNGEKFPIEISISPAKQENGWSAITIIRDISKRKSADEAFRKAHFEIELLLSSISFAIISVDKDNVVTRWNEAAERIFRLAEEEIVGRSLFECNVNWDWSKINECITRCHDSGRDSYINEIRYVGPVITDGLLELSKESFLDISISPIITEFDEWDGFIILARDVTEKKKDHEQLRIASTVYNNVLEGIIVTDAKGIIQSVNPSFTTITGYTEKDVIGQNPRILKSGLHDKAFYKEMWESLHSKGKWEGEFWNKRKDGSIHPEWRSMASIKDTNGEIAQYISAFHDITDIKKAEENIRLLQERTSAILKTIGEGIVVVDMDLRIHYANQELVNIFGYSIEDLVGEHTSALLPEKERGLLTSGMGRYLEGKPQKMFGHRFETKGLRKDGSVFPLEVRIEETKINEQSLFLTAALRDITDKKRTDDELRRQGELLAQSEKLAAIGELASGVAHEINQPLNHINITNQLLTKILSKEKVDKNACLEELNVIRENVERAVGIIRNIREFSRRESRDNSRFDVNEAIGNAVKMFESKLETHNISLQANTPERTVFALGSKGRLSQVIVNLISNARDALNSLNNGRKRSIAIDVKEKDSNVVILINDNGPGIPKKIIKDIFNPFFTTKAPGKGTGLGLSISYKIIQGFGGSLEVESKKGVGTTIRIKLLKASEKKDENEVY